MPWKEYDKVSEKIKFLSRILDGEKMTDVCREFEISRVTGYKIWNRYLVDGVDALQEHSRRPWRVGNKTPVNVEREILGVKERYPTWGAPKVKAYLERNKKNLKIPSQTTVHAILDRHGLVKHRNKRRRIYKAKGTRLKDVSSANQLWCADFKGQFRLGNQKYCYPLTITDQHSRYILECEALESVREVGAISCFKRVFREHGLPETIRTDNGIPFSSRSLFGLSKLSVMWLRLGIEVERIVPGHPEQNGRHERMHRTLKQEVTKPAGSNLLKQQEMFDSFVKVFNEERPHESLDMDRPSDVYSSSLRTYPEVYPEIDYSDCDDIRRIASCGSIKHKGSKKIFISDVFGGENVGLNQIDDKVWSVRFMDYILGYYEKDEARFYASSNPFRIDLN